MKPLLIGEAPSKNEVTETPLEGRVGRRLAALCDLSYAEYLERFERVNLLHVRQDTADKGFKFDHVAAVKAVNALYGTNILEERVVLLLGWRVARAFFLDKAYTGRDYFELHEQCLGTRIYVLPHPSGINRWWNESENWKRAAKFLQALIVESENPQA